MKPANSRRSIHASRVLLMLALGWLPLSACPASNRPAASDDPRFNLNFSPEYRPEFLAEMRKMLGSVQGILQGIGTGDRALIAASARLSGNVMARATPAQVRAGLPQAFRDLGGPTHLMMEELAIRAETDEMDALARFAAEMLNQCMACHAAFRTH